VLLPIPSALEVFKKEASDHQKATSFSKRKRFALGQIVGFPAASMCSQNHAEALKQHKNILSTMSDSDFPPNITVI
jgi:hypothetical protein